MRLLVLRRVAGAFGFKVYAPLRWAIGAAATLRRKIVGPGERSGSRPLQAGASEKKPAADNDAGARAAPALRAAALPNPAATGTRAETGP